MLPAIAVVSGILGALILLSIPMYLWLPDITQAGDLARIIQAAITATAIVATGIFAAVKFQLFREFEPHLNITHEISCQQIGNSYVHLGVTAILHNTSKVKIEILRATFALQQISPITDEMIEKLYAEMYGMETKRIEWPVLDEMEQNWNRNGLIIEPGETHRETQEFIVSRETKYVLVYTHFCNYTHSPKSQNDEGWTTISFYDIIPKSSE